MTRAFALALSAVLGAGLVAGCSTDRGPETLIDPQGVDQLVLDAVLIVDRPFPSVYLSRTASPLDPFTFGNVAEAGAYVVIRTPDKAVAFYKEGAVAGAYDVATTNGPSLVLPETRYDIEVVTLDGARVEGTTITPPRFSVDRWVLLDNDGQTVRRQLEPFVAGDAGSFDRNQITYADGLLEARFVRPDVPAFQVGVQNLEEDSPLLVKPDFLDDEALSKLERTLSSPALTGEGSSLRLPWLAIYYEGRTMIRIHAIDRNWYDLVRSTPGLDNGPGAFAFGGNLGEGFEQPIFHLTGGIGLFGSASVDSIGFDVLAP